MFQPVLQRRSVLLLRSSQSVFNIYIQACQIRRSNAFIFHAARYQSTNRPGLGAKNVSKYPDPAPEDAQAIRSQPRSRLDLSSIRKAIKEHPYQGGLAIIIISFATACIISVVGFELWAKYYVKHNYPEAVAKSIRKALYFTNIQPDPARALRFYKEALFGAQEAGLHPISDEVIGLKLQLGWFFEEKSYAIDNAIVVYEGVYKDCVEWLTAEGEKHVADGHRTRVLERAVRTAVKLGELYGMPQIKRFEDSEEILSIATETVVKERQRRKGQGVVKDDRDFLSDDEVGGTMERLAEAYTKRNKPHLAAPLYLHAIQLCPKDSCHSVILMNNLASAVAEQAPPPASVALPKDFPSPSQQAEMWARQALELAARIPASKRDEECTTGCATARANIAELVERDGRLAEALVFFQQAEKESQSVGFKEGVRVASEGKLRVSRALNTKTT